LFWANCIYNDVGWTERKLGDCSWENEEIFLKDTQSIFDLVDRVTDNFHKFARERVASHWTVAQPSDDFVNVSEDQSRQRLIPGNLHQLKPIETNPQDTETDDTPSSSESQERSNW
jgi:hypothetical protein